MTLYPLTSSFQEPSSIKVRETTEKFPKETSYFWILREELYFKSDACNGPGVVVPSQLTLGVPKVAVNDGKG